MSNCVSVCSEHRKFAPNLAPGVSFIHSRLFNEDATNARQIKKQ